MNGTLAMWFALLGVFCAAALAGGWWLFTRSRDKQHRDWTAMEDDDDDTR